MSFYVIFALTLILLIVASDYYWRVVGETCVKLGETFVNWLGVHGNKATAVPNIEVTETGQFKEEEDLAK